VPSAPTNGDWIPRPLHDKTVMALTNRCVEAEDAVVRLLNSIDPELLVRHGQDYVAAVKELVA
jgi:hypothetical protein